MFRIRFQGQGRKTEDAVARPMGGRGGGVAEGRKPCPLKCRCKEKKFKSFFGKKKDWRKGCCSGPQLPTMR